MLQRFRRLLSRKSQDEQFVETKYFEKYKDLVDRKVILQLLKELESSDIMFEFPGSQLTQPEEEELYRLIDESDLASPQEKCEAVIGLMGILSGSFPQPRLMAHLERVFGKEFIEAYEAKRGEFKTQIAVKELTRKLREQTSAGSAASEHEARTENETFCLSCGARLPKNANFCQQCNLRI